MDIIYHERQLQGSVHTFNDLIAIAQSLDEQEMPLLGDTQYFQSQNMDNSGNFSIQVVENALALCGLQLITLHSSYPRAVAARQNTCSDNF